MALPQHKTCLSILRSILGPVAGGEARFAKTIGRSKSWIKKASAGIIQLSEDAAIRISHETGVSHNWLLANNPSIPPVCLTEDVPPWQLDPKQFHNHPAANATSGADSLFQDGQSFSRPFTREVYDNRRASLQSGLEQTGSMLLLTGDIVSLLEISIHAEKLNKLPLFHFKLREFLEATKQQFVEYQSHSNNQEILKLATDVKGIADYIYGGGRQAYFKSIEDGVEPTPQKKQPSRKSKRPA